MTPKRKTVSGGRCVKILCNVFGFTPVRRKGSHTVLKHRVKGNVTVVPMHREVKRGTLKSVLRLASIDESEFFKHT